jgi:hypothetical protein
MESDAAGSDVESSPVESSDAESGDESGASEPDGIPNHEKEPEKDVEKE